MMSFTNVRAIIVQVLCVIGVVHSFYLPGVAPKSFHPGEEVELKVNKLSSTHTQLPYDYYSLKFCKPAEGIKPYSENLGEFLDGDRIENSAYEIAMLEDENCKVLCQVTLTNENVNSFKSAIRNKYHHNWIIDNLPAASIVDAEESVSTQFVGFPVGYQEGNLYYIYNHVNIILEYHTVESNGHRIVGFYVEPISVKHQPSRSWDGKGNPPSIGSCMSTTHVDYDSSVEHQKLATGPLIFTYGVEWRESEVHWASRWDIYLSMNNSIPDAVHWFPIVNSLLIVMFLTFMVAMILYRNLAHDITKYNRVPTSEEAAADADEKGWKLVHADVFRAPQHYPLLFSVFVGTGTQLAIAALIFIVFASIGFLSPANRGSIMIGGLLLFVLLGCVAGYVSSKLYKSFKGKKWQLCTMMTATLYPGIVFTVFFLLDILVWSYGSTGAVPIGSFLALLALWFGISVPLVFLGAYFGYKDEVIEYPVITAAVPRPIPDQPWYFQYHVIVLMGGILPFSACFVELFFIMSSLWMDQYYYVFGFLFLVYGILVVTCAEIAIVFTYFQLCSEDYRWWWRSFVVAGSTGLYVFAYSIWYFAKLESNMAITYMLYFGYMGLVSLGIFLITGTLGFLSSYAFNYVIYSSIKVD